MITDQQKKFIEIHSTLPEWTDEKIAEHLNIATITVKKYRKRAGIIKGQKGTIKEIKEASKTERIAQKVKYAENDEQRRKYFKQGLLLSPRSKRLYQMLDEEDFEYFCDRWIEYHIQFPDMSASEEDNLEKLILIDLRIFYNTKSMKECIALQNKLRASLNQKSELDPENDKDLQIIHTINSQNTQEQALNAELTKLTKEYKEILEAMNGTRAQREASQKVGATTFLDLVHKFNQMEVRKEAGRFNELVRLSKEKKLKDLQQPHKYVDGTYDLPILDGATIKAAKQEENARGKINE